MEHEFLQKKNKKNLQTFDKFYFLYLTLDLLENIKFCVFSLNVHISDESVY